MFAQEYEVKGMNRVGCHNWLSFIFQKCTMMELKGIERKCKIALNETKIILATSLQVGPQ